MRALNGRLPYKPSNPRSVRGARKRGWTVVKPRLGYVEKVSWTGLCIWCDARMSGYFIPSFRDRAIAFEKASDATAFAMKWG